jgi:hypothetical protein
MIDLVYVYSNLSAKGKRYLCNFEKCVGPLVLIG